jgi:hypothetical protein
MPENTRAPIDRRSITPSQLPLSEQAALFERLWTPRQQRPPSSWQRLAVEEGFAQRTLEHFYLRALKLEANADKRPRLVMQEEREGRFFHAQLAAIPPRRALVPPSAVPEDFVPPALRRELTPSQLSLREQAALFIELQEARSRRPPPSWNYLAILHGFAPRTLEHFYRTAKKLENNPGRRSVFEIFGAVLRARRAGAPAGRRSAPDSAELRERRAAERRRAKTRAAQTAEAASPAAEADPSAPVLDEQREAEARDEQQRRADELFASAAEIARAAEEERLREFEEEHPSERDSISQRDEVWDPWWGPNPVESPFDI